LTESVVEAVQRILSDLYGRECATAIVAIENKKAGGDPEKLISNIRRVLVQVGGEKYAADIYERLMDKIGGAR